MQLQLPARRALAVASAAAVVATVAGTTLAALPAQAATLAPPAGDPFAVTTTLTPPNNPALGWRDLRTGATGTYSTPAATPAISPDGTKAAVLTEDGKTDASDVTVVDLATGAATTVTRPSSTDTETLLDPAWSSDGGTIYFTRESGLPGSPADAIYSVPATATAATGTPFLPAGQNGAYPTSSPSGGITYVDETPETQCVVQQLATAGGTPTCLVPSSALPSGVIDVLLPKWSHDGATLALGYETQTGTGIAVVPVSGGTAGTLRTLPATTATGTSDAPYTVSGVSWTGDDSQVIYSVGRFSASNNYSPVNSGVLRSVDVTTGSVAATIAASSNVGADTHVPATSTSAGAQFAPLAPTRIADTRTGLGGHSGPLGAGASFDLTVTGTAVSGTGIDVPTNAVAVALNVTAANPSATGYLSVFPTPASGSAAPTVSTLNLSPHRDVADAAIVRVGAGGKVRVLNVTGSANVAVDIAGYYVPAGTAAGALNYQPLSAPARLLDTRTDGGPIGAAATRDLTVAGHAGVPTSASAVVLNLTGIADAQTYVSAYPAGGTPPVVSNLNLLPGETRANLVTVQLPPSSDANAGTVTLYNNQGDTQVVVDVEGYYDAAAPDQYVPLDSPLRVLDTRNGTYSAIGAAPLPGAHAMGATVTGTLTTSTGEAQVPSNADAAVFNLTGVAPTSLTYLEAYPAGTAMPTASTLNLPAGGTVPNLSITRIGTQGQVALYNNLGKAHLLADLAGYFVPTS